MVGLIVLVKNIGYLLKILFIKDWRFAYQKRNFVLEFHCEDSRGLPNEFVELCNSRAFWSPLGSHFVCCILLLSLES